MQLFIIFTDFVRFLHCSIFSVAMETVPFDFVECEEAILCYLLKKLEEFEKSRGWKGAFSFYRHNSISYTT